MPATGAQRNEARAAEMADLAISGLIVHLGVSHAEAAKILYAASREKDDACGNQGSAEEMTLVEITLLTIF